MEQEMMKLQIQWKGIDSGQYLGKLLPGISKKQRSIKSKTLKFHAARLYFYF